MVRYPELQSAINELLYTYQAQHPDQSLGDVQLALCEHLHVTGEALRKWRQGRHRPSPAVLQQLVAFGLQQVGLRRAWAAELLTGMDLPDPAAYVATLAPTPLPPDAPRHNLPHRSYP